MTNQIDRAILSVLGDGDQYKLLEIYIRASAYPITFFWFWKRRIAFREVRPSLERLEKAGLVSCGIYNPISNSKVYKIAAK